MTSVGYHSYAVAPVIVPHLVLFWFLAKAVFCDYGISLVTYLTVLFFFLLLLLLFWVQLFKALLA